LNLAYAPPRATGQGGQTQAAAQGQASGRTGATGDEGPRVTLDIENEAVQDVFNTVLQITGLEANRVGRTVYVSPRLPDDARNVITRTLRLNQANATSAANFLVSQGAELQLPITRETVVTLGTGVNAQNTILREPDIKVIKAQPGNAPLPLSGLAVSADARLNAVVISGVPRKVEVASALLSQLDARRRQVTVNVRVIDMNLSNFEQAGFSFSFGIGANRFINQGGLGIFNFGTSVPATVTVPTQVGSSPIGAVAPQSLTNPLNNFVSNFFAQLQLQVTNGNAKILTDPTLVVQEGQQATVNLTQEVISNVKVETSGGGTSTGTGTVTVTTEKANVGVTLGINVDRIDDNGFVTLSLNPVVSAPTQTFNVTIPGFGGSPASTQQITLVQQRSLSSGLLRLRDGQTLIAAGIIQDGDRAEVTKIPILGDIPILGALFRRNVRTNQRNEVIILLTPRILDDTDRSSFGYNYTPGPGVRQILEQPR
jgi:type IV pilus assembly protein PilQ